MPRSPIEELRSRLDQHGGRVAKVALTHSPCDGGPRTLVQIFNGSGAKIDEWDDWVLPNDVAFLELSERWADINQDGIGYVCTFTLRVPRRRARAEAQP